MKAMATAGKPSGSSRPKAPSSKNVRPAAADILPERDQEAAPRHVNLASLLSKQTAFSSFRLWIIGDTPLITHAWSEKAKREMLAKQVKAIKPGKDPRDPHADFVSSLYEMGEVNGLKSYGFPATGVKNAILASAHKDKGIARVSVMSSLWMNAAMVRTRPALAGAICDMPLIRIWGDAPQNREDMVKIGSGLNKTANLAYRGQFTIWAMRITGKFNSAVLSPETLLFLLQESGLACGLGEWRNERRGMFGAFHVGTPEEEVEWEAFAAGEGELPVPASYTMAAE
jgi:hypothetical protein